MFKKLQQSSIYLDHIWLQVIVYCNMEVRFGKICMVFCPWKLNGDTDCFCLFNTKQNTTKPNQTNQPNKNNINKKKTKTKQKMKQK